MCWVSAAKLWCVRAWIAICGCAFIVGSTLFVDFRECRGEDTLTAEPEAPDSPKPPSKDHVYFAPTVEWLPKPQNDIPDAQAETEADMRAYTETIPGNKVTFDMLPIRGGWFLMGSPEEEPKRRTDEGPRRKVHVEPFWMGRCEVTWDEFELFAEFRDHFDRTKEGRKPTAQDMLADALSCPSSIPYTDLSMGMGRDGCPAICMTQLGAKLYCRWLSAKTGRYYRLPTEAEWEYACRAGTKTAYSFGNNPDKLDQYAWHYDNSDERYHPVGQKKPNPWGLHDMHGNVAEWVLDQYVADFYSQSAGRKEDRSPLAIPRATYPRVVRGGSWDDDPEELRSAARQGSTKEWSREDPMVPTSAMWHTNAFHVGFRVVRPYRLPTAAECERLEGIKRDYLLRGDLEWTRQCLGAEDARTRRSDGQR